MRIVFALTNYKGEFYCKDIHGFTTDLLKNEITTYSDHQGAEAGMLTMADIAPYGIVQIQKLYIQNR